MLKYSNNKNGQAMTYRAHLLNILSFLTALNSHRNLKQVLDLLLAKMKKRSKPNSTWLRTYSKLTSLPTNSFHSQQRKRKIKEKSQSMMRRMIMDKKIRKLRKSLKVITMSLNLLEYYVLLIATECEHDELIGQIVPEY